MEIKIIEEIRSVLKDASLTMIELLKILIPVSIIVKILKETEIIPVVGEWLAPLMTQVGLPGDYGLVLPTVVD